MDPTQRQRIREDLAGSFRGELLFDDLTCALYATDASIFEVQPAGVVVPHDEEDVQVLVRYAAASGLSLIPRGAGTGLAGESLGAGLIVDLSRHFRQILAIDEDTVRVQPGVVLRDLRQALAAVGRRFAPDPANEECTLGGMIATNASGPRALRFGYIRDHVVNLRVVLDSGEAVEVGRRSRWAVQRAESEDEGPGRLDDIVSSLATLLQQQAEALAQRNGTVFDRCGYRLDGVLAGDEVDLARLLVGSEGTLGIVTEATLRTIPLPTGRAVVLAAFTSQEAALRVAQDALALQPTACELLDRRLIRLARAKPSSGLIPPSRVADLLPSAAEAVLLIEFEGNSPAEARKTALDLAAELGARPRRNSDSQPPLLVRVAADPDEIDRFWQVRQTALPSLYGLRGGARPVAFVEDIGIPLPALCTYLVRVQEVLHRHEVTASFLIHAGTGQVHMRPFLDLGDPADVARMWSLADDVYPLVWELGGTISTQHGVGLARTPWVARQFGRFAGVLREVKAIFDPGHLFNPGKIVPAGGPGEYPAGQLPNGAGVPGAAWPLRRQPQATREEGSLEEGESTPVSAPLSERFLLWQGSPAEEISACNGCGECRIASGSVAERMCPIFRATGDEAATPRAKANLMRHLLAPDTDSSLLSSDEVRAVADLCVNCKMCAHECPAHVRIPKLMLEAKAANVARHGIPWGDKLLARSESWARLGSLLAPMTNWLLANGATRWLLEKLLGVSRRRRLPHFAVRSFLRRARRRGWTQIPQSPGSPGSQGRPRVAYFADVFANYNDTSIAEALVEVLQHNGVEVYVPPDQVGCGMAELAYGDVEGAREILQRNLRVLADVAREGFTVLCSEPTAALMFTQDALDLSDDPDVQLVATQTQEATAYLWDLHLRGQLRTDFARLELAVGHHVPCHQKALGGPPRGPALLGLIPGLRVQTIDVSCSGMAGTFGFKAEHYDLSRAAGRPMLEELARPRHLVGSTECSACRLQMEDGTGKRTLHPVQYLALAYGLAPELMDRLRKPVGKRVLG